MQCVLVRVEFVLAMSVVAGAAGCSGKPQNTLPTVPVAGKVVFVHNGDAKNLYNRQGSIEFESIDQPGVKAYGAIWKMAASK